MYAEWYYQHLRSYEDSLAPFHDIVAFRVRDTSSVVEKSDLSEAELPEWLNQHKDEYLFRGL